jgi:hypothetical protein
MMDRMQMNRMHEIFQSYREEHGINAARMMAKQEYLTEMIDDLCESELTTEQKLDKIIAVLELMNMKIL